MAKHGFPRGELYVPRHFGNRYEVAGRFEMRDILSEAEWWGFNSYGDWFDTVNLVEARRVFNRLASKAPYSWRLAHFASKLMLFESNRRLEEKKHGLLSL